MSSGGAASSLPPTAVRKHGWSHFSLRRLFNTTAISRRNIARHRTAHMPAEIDSHSESSSNGFGATSEGKSSAAFKANYRLASIGHSSLDSESNSLSSGRSESQHDGCLSARVASGGGGNAAANTECPLCLLELPPECFPELLACSHRACYDCLQQYLKIEISESRVNVSCPECTEPIHPNDIRMILNDDNIMCKYEAFMLRRVLVTEPDARWCPAPDCGYVVVASGCASCPKLKCERPGCGTYFCYHCKQEWHPNQTCDAARAQRARHSPNPRPSSMPFGPDTTVQRDDIKPCPCCKVLIIKMDDGSCNHMTCSVCGTEFCWLCMKEISDLHYLSPSGCTFWGKKPWSRKKKIMWQLGMLVGAPVGIALIAGIAVPAIIIGIPVWVGRKLHAKYRHQPGNKHKRNLVVTGGVLSSILVSPVLAGIAVGIGVPILLAYVYGVVPISLCRSGGCGVTTSASGVRIEFDEENEMNNAAADGASVDTAVSHRGANPSIGEVSFGMSTSLSMGSGSHLDRAGVIRDRDSDRESASNTGIAGSIASASLSGPATHKYGLEVQADVSSNKRFSLSSHSETASATVSLSERSANMSLLDDASTRALAGSFLGCREGTSAVTPVEVHVDAHSTSEDVPFSYLTLKPIDGQSCGTTCTEEGDEGTVASYCCSSEDRSSISSSCRGSTRASSSRWQQPPHRLDSGGILHLASPSSDAESQCSHTTGTAPYRDISVSFIDESPQSTDNTDNTVSLNPSICGENLLTDGASYDTDKPAASVAAAEEGLKAVSFRTEPDAVSTSSLSSKRDLPRRSAKYESRSLEHLVGYCDQCQKTHRPCCPNAYHAHQPCIGGMGKMPAQESNNSACCDHGPASAMMRKLCSGPGGASTNDFLRTVAIGSSQGGPKVDLVASSSTKQQQQHLASSTSRNSSPSSSVAVVSCLPQVEEPERTSLLLPISNATLSASSSSCGKKSRPTSAPSSASWRKRGDNDDPNKEDDMGFPTEILICSGMDLRRESV